MFILYLPATAVRCGRIYTRQPYDDTLFSIIVYLAILFERLLHTSRLTQRMSIIIVYCVSRIFSPVLHERQYAIRTSLCSALRRYVQTKRPILQTIRGYFIWNTVYETEIQWKFREF